ncbi:tripartite tricarboxylate transporter TctB family protein [bacterium]|nr:tripartite tricarboxylate transporter TctB family protein [bacterium]
MSDRIFGGIGLALAAFYVWAATTIELSFISDPVGPKTFPFIIGGLFALASLAILLRPDAPPEWPSMTRLAEIAAGVAVMVAYVYLLPSAGFVIATALGTAYLSWRLGAAPVSAVVAGLATSGGIFVVFHLVLGLTLAKGPLGI